MGGLEGALALGVIWHLVLGGTEISVSLSSLSLALLSPHETRAASPSPSFERELPSLSDSVRLFQTSLLPDVTTC